MYSASTHKTLKSKELEGVSGIAGKYIILITIMTFLFLSFAKSEKLVPGNTGQTSIICGLSYFTGGVDHFVKMDQLDKSVRGASMDDS